jgi:hypothetical protein
MSRDVTKILQDFLAEIPKPDEKICFEQGYDCEMNGANETNCHFSLFRSPAHMMAWQRGKEVARLTKRTADSLNAGVNSAKRRVVKAKVIHPAKSG